MRPHVLGHPMRIPTLVLAVVLATAAIAFAPAASADTCRSTIAENTVCTPVYAVYCAMYGVKYAVSCEASVVARCVQYCPSDVNVVLP